MDLFLLRRTTASRPGSPMWVFNFYPTVVEDTVPNRAAFLGTAATNRRISAPVAVLHNRTILSILPVTVSRLCRKLDLPKGASLPVLRHSQASLLLAAIL